MSSIKKNFLYNSAYQILVMFIPLLTTPYISRVLGAEGIGVYSYAFSVASYYVLFIMLGLNNYGNRTIAQSRDDDKELSKQFWSIYALQFFLGIVINVIYFFYCIILAENKNIALSMWLYVISASFDVNWFFFGMEMFKKTVIRNAIIKIVTTSSIFLLVKGKNDILMYCLIMTVGMFLSQIVLWPYVLKNVKFYRPSIEEIKIHIKPNLFLFLTVIAVSLFKIMDKIMLGIMTNKEQVGFYESSEKIISIPTALITSLGTVMLPRMSNLVSNKNIQSNEIISKSIAFAMLLSSSMCFGIMGVSKEFVPIFYGKGYETCIYLFLILLPTCLFMAFANVIRTQYLLPHKKDSAYVISAFLGAIVNVVVNVILIPQYGSIGAAIGTICAEVAVCIYQSYTIRKEQPIKVYLKASIPFIMSGILMFLIIFNIYFVRLPLIINLIIKIIIGVVIYFVTLFTQIFIVKVLRRGE